ncbi:hypothetical protein AN964_07760 [Heyndrickxia shackletonii]|uniref:Type IV pilus assembly protein PilN n=1 Tax=Heyndrickxia shackletonii TaxID=157838 RepID=A0A0Q3WR22_9BACI|nr:PilN domain-containing protein [Heyndrickxia shackletonii]KQL53397.1 hypothetical protein AN964_07760 [Heyndrickxia shackletonii]NEY99966.1 PilN domain-containing protein [Heyndrickxia shackletonii]
MLVDINLIEKKHRPNLFWFVLSGILIILAVSLAIFYSYYTSIKQQEAVLNSQLIYEKQLNKVKQNIPIDKKQQAILDLKKAIQWANDYPISTVSMLKEIITLLPERGFITHFSLRDDRTVQLTVQFDTSNDAAYYMRHLNQAKFVRDVKIENITTADMNASDQNILPRYFAQYTIILNESYLKNKNGKEE